MDETELLRVMQAAKRAGLTEGGIRDAMRRGALPFVERYGVKLIKPEDLDAYRATVKIGRPRKDTGGNTQAELPVANLLLSSEEDK